MILRVCLEGLQIMLDSGLVYCDMKPQNLLLTETAVEGEYRVKFIDLISACNLEKYFQRQEMYPTYFSKRYLDIDLCNQLTNNGANLLTRSQILEFELRSLQVTLLGLLGN